MSHKNLEFKFQNHFFFFVDANGLSLLSENIFSKIRKLFFYKADERKKRESLKLPKIL